MRQEISQQHKIKNLKEKYIEKHGQIEKTKNLPITQDTKSCKWTMLKKPLQALNQT